MHSILRLVRLFSSDKRPSWIEGSQLHSEKSGLIESSCLRFLLNLLRRHGLDPTTLKSRVGSSLSDAAWKAGDLVTLCSNKSRDYSLDMIGRVCDVIKPTMNNSPTIPAVSPKVTVEFYDSSIWRNSGMSASSTQRIMSGLLSSMPITSFSPSSLVYAGLNVSLFKLPNELHCDGSILDGMEEDVSNDSKYNLSLSSIISTVAKLDSSAITSLCTMVLDDSSLISKLCSQGLLDAIIQALDKVHSLLVHAIENKTTPRKLDTHIVRALIHILFLICQKICEPGNPHVLNLHGKATSTDALTDQPNSLRMYLRGKNRQLSKETSISNQDVVRVTSLVERGLLCNDARWVSKALNISNRNFSNAASNINSLQDEDGDSLLTIGCSFGCSTNILKCLIKAGCTVTNRDIKIAALSNQPDALLLLLRYSSYDDSSLDLTYCSEGIKEILAQAVLRQKKESSYLTDVGHSFTSNAIAKVLHLLYAVHGNSRDPSSSSYFQDIAKLLEGALFGNISCSQELFKVKILDPLVSSRFNKDRIDDQAYQRSAFFPLIPDVLVSEAILQRPDPKILSDSISPLQYCLNLLESLLCTKDRQENYAGFVLAYYVFKSGIDISNADLDRYGFHDLVLLHIRRIEKACASDADDETKTAGSIRCPQGHEARFHVTDKNSFRCDLCDRAIKIGKGLHGCRICDWDVCEVCLQYDEGRNDTIKMKSMANKCFQLILQRRCSTDIRQDNDLRCIVKGIRNMERDSLRTLAARLNCRGQVPMYTFAKVFLPVIYSSVLMCIENRNHAPTTIESNILPRRKKARVESTMGGDASDDFLQMLIDELILPSFHNSNFTVDIKSSVSCENDEIGDESYDEEPHAVALSSVPPLLRMLHQLLAVYEDCFVARYVCPKQSDLESLSTPFDLEWSLVPSEGHHSVLHSLIAEPTVPISDIRRYIIQKFPSIESKYLNYCRR